MLPRLPPYAKPRAKALLAAVWPQILGFPFSSQGTIFRRSDKMRWPIEPPLDQFDHRRQFPQEAANTAG
jgi:hypothetical protein